MSTTPLSPLEQKAFNLIRKAGKKGILQSELWHRLGIDSREGSRIALKLLKRGLIGREPVTHNGKRTYRLYIKKVKEVTERIKLNGVIDIPCFTCPLYSKCSEGSYINPSTCVKLTEWIIQGVLSKKSKEG